MSFICFILRSRQSTGKHNNKQHKSCCQINQSEAVWNFVWQIYNPHVNQRKFWEIDSDMSMREKNRRIQTAGHCCWAVLFSDGDTLIGRATQCYYCCYCCTTHWCIILVDYLLHQYYAPVSHIGLSQYWSTTFGQELPGGEENFLCTMLDLVHFSLVQRKNWCIHQGARLQCITAKQSTDIVIAKLT